MTTDDPTKGFLCAFCDGPHVRAYKIAGALVKYACDECFLTRCISCGILCVDEQGHLLEEVKFGLNHALYCERCLSSSDAGGPAGLSG